MASEYPEITGSANWRAWSGRRGIVLRPDRRARLLARIVQNDVDLAISNPVSSISKVEVDQALKLDRKELASQPAFSASLLSAKIYARLSASLRWESLIVGTALSPRSLAASTRRAQQ